MYIFASRSNQIKNLLLFGTFSNLQKVYFVLLDSVSIWQSQYFSYSILVVNFELLTSSEFCNEKVKEHTCPPSFLEPFSKSAAVFILISILKWRITPGVACFWHRHMTFRIWSIYFGSKLFYQYLWVSFWIRILQYSHTRGSGQFSWSGRVKVWVSGEQVAPILLVAVALLPLLSLLESSLVLLLVLLSPLLFFEELKLLLTPPFFVLLFILPSPQEIVTLKKEPAL